MSAIFNKAGRKIPVTAVVADSNIVVEIRDSKILLGFGRKKKSKKTENALVKAVGYSPRIIKEVPVSHEEENTNNKIKVGDKITVSIFKSGDEVKVTGTTKGRGFAGSVKRWGFAGGPKTHGQSDRHRAPGSIGAGTTPGRVFKGKKMAGHMGNARLTVTGLEVIDVVTDKNLLLVKGAIPGPKTGILIIEKTGQVKKPSMTATFQTIEKAKENEEQKSDESKAENAQAAQETADKKGEPKLEEPKESTDKEVKKEAN